MNHSRKKNYRKQHKSDKESANEIQEHDVLDDLENKVIIPSRVSLPPTPEEDLEDPPEEIFDLLSIARQVETPQNVENEAPSTVVSSKPEQKKFSSTIPLSPSKRNQQSNSSIGQGLAHKRRQSKDGNELPKRRRFKSNFDNAQS